MRQRSGKERAGLKEFGSGGLAVTWLMEIEGLGIRLQRSVGHDTISRRGGGRTGVRKTSPVDLDTQALGAREAWAQPQLCLLPAV